MKTYLSLIAAFTVATTALPALASIGTDRVKNVYIKTEKTKETDICAKIAERKNKKRSFKYKNLDCKLSNKTA